MLDGTDSVDSLKYVLHSVHDTQLIAVMEWLKPMNFIYTEQPYASTFYMELHYDPTCISSKKDHSCFTIELYNNGTPLKIKSCIDANKQRAAPSEPHCKVDDFIAYFEKELLFKGDIDQGCLKTFQPRFELEESND